MKSPLQAVASALLTVCVLVAPSQATWSIVLTDTSTGEVIVASATCIENFDLQVGLPVVRPDIGGAAAQSMIDTGAVNRQKIWNKLGQGLRPSTIIKDLEATDRWHQARQYGIVNLKDKPATFTGNGAGKAKGGVTGEVGTLRYSIQGNVLTDKSVYLAAETALLNTPGDLGQRVLAGMEAARALGGDGRCSCNPAAPTSCGAPPPGFTKSAHVGFFIIARHGDSEGTCSGSTGCANGSYYLDLNVKGNAAALDPVLQMQADYAIWRAGLVGHPDGVLSSLDIEAHKLPADGQTTRRVTVVLRDLDGTPIGHGGATLTPSSTAGLVSFSGVTDNADGSYAFDVTAMTQAGDDSIEVLVDDGVTTATLYPPLDLTLDAPAMLHAGENTASITDGFDVPFTLDFGASSAASPYLLLGSLSGTTPGLPFAGGTLPLNSDALLTYTLTSPGAPFLPGSVGVLDAAGRGEAHVVAPPGALPAFIGLHTDWAAVTLAAPELASSAVGLDLVL